MSGGTDIPRGAPLPPGDFAKRWLPVQDVAGGELLHRIHRLDLGPVFFGPGAGNPPMGRWDAPAGEFGVCYLALEPYVAFAETFLRVPGIVSLGEDDLRRRGLAQVRVMRTLQLAEFHGAGLARVGATAAVCSGSHDVSRAWSAAIHAHRRRVDGILYRARHDDDGFAVALFDRAAESIRIERSGSLLDEGIVETTGAILDRYGLALDSAAGLGEPRSRRSRSQGGEPFSAARIT
ncbi:MAG TPA: RES family NAD+ phosphorylase [Longimicrobiaceae bacterium]|nr:RES family NAD+ phosphorylase [Longimicrobiaceae bacterium]